jgi:hypothetical protein
MLAVLAAALLALPLLRPFFKGLERADGLVWLPPVAVVALAAVAPAYGFKIELFPLFALAVVYTVKTVPDIARVAGGRPAGVWPETAGGHVIWLILVAITTGVAVGISIWGGLEGLQIIWQ